MWAPEVHEKESINVMVIWGCALWQGSPAILRIKPPYNEVTEGECADCHTGIWFIRSANQELAVT